MSNIKVGSFIKQLRKEMNLSQQDFAEELFSKYDIDITGNAISRWESGGLPEIDRMCKLADYFNITMDELLEGERFIAHNFDEEYYIIYPDWVEKLNIPKDEIYFRHQSQVQKIISTFNNYVNKKIHEGLNINEEAEFRFLFEHFYIITNYAFVISNDNTNDDYLNFISAFNEVKNDRNLLSDEEVIFEIQKLYRPNFHIDLSFNNICDLEIQEENRLAHFNLLPSWEKDILLCLVQEYDPIIDIPRTESDELRYKEKYGRDYNSEVIIKSTIKILVENGACLNKKFLQIIKNNKKRYSVIDKLENLYDIAKRPLSVSVISEDAKERKFYNVENTSKNRFLNEYYYKISAYFKFLDADRLYDLFMRNESMEDREVILALAEANGLKLERSISSIKKELTIHIYGLKDAWNSCKEKEHVIATADEQIEKYKSMLEAGEYYLEEIEVTKLMGENYGGRRNILLTMKDSLTYDEYNSYKMKSLTKELLSSLDSLTVKEIRAKFFKEEVIDND